MNTQPLKELTVFYIDADEKPGFGWRTVLTLAVWLAGGVVFLGCLWWVTYLLSGGLL